MPLSKSQMIKETFLPSNLTRNLGSTGFIPSLFLCFQALLGFLLLLNLKSRKHHQATKRNAYILEISGTNRDIIEQNSREPFLTRLNTLRCKIFAKKLTDFDNSRNENTWEKSSDLLQKPSGQFLNIFSCHWVGFGPKAQMKRNSVDTIQIEKIEMLKCKAEKQVVKSSERTF